jgi:hypothetical protein
MNIFMEKATIEPIFYDSLESVVEYIPKMLGAIEEMVEAFRRSDEGKGTRIFLQAIDGLQWIHEIVSGQHAYLKNHFNISISDDLAVHHLQESLQQLLEAMEQQDYILMADVLEYELSPYLQRVWKNTAEMWEELDIRRTDGHPSPFPN